MGSQKLQNIVESKFFIRLTSIMIICCSIVLGIETSFPAHLSVFQVIDAIFTAYFAIEIIIRILAEPNTLQFFKLFHLEKHKGKIATIHFEEKGFWNWFDFLITGFSIFSLVVHVFEHPEFLVVGRLFRVLRILRLLEVSQELKEVERKIVSIIPTVFSFALLLGILIYIYSIIGIYLFSHHKYENADFSSLGSSFLSLFQLMTLEGWVDMMYQASSHYENSWFIKGYFISFVILTVIISFNVFVAVLTSQVQEKINAENILEEKKILKNMENSLKENNQELSKHLIALAKEIESLKSEIKELKKTP
ncbi:MAG: ion transporter [Raineya sp.]|jgi:voltage-gated sodium channel|nr:ion transporter [Raineya sp.]